MEQRVTSTTEVFPILDLPFPLCPCSVLPLWNLFHLPTKCFPKFDNWPPALLLLYCGELLPGLNLSLPCPMSYKSANIVVFFCFVSSLVLSTRHLLLSIQMTPTIQIKSWTDYCHYLLCTVLSAGYWTVSVSPPFSKVHPLFILLISQWLFPASTRTQNPHSSSSVGSQSWLTVWSGG